MVFKYNIWISFALYKLMTIATNRLKLFELSSELLAPGLPNDKVGTTFVRMERVHFHVTELCD